MNINWKHFVFALILGLIVGMAMGLWSRHSFYGKAGSSEERFKKHFEYFSKKLSLDDGQREKIRRIVEEKRERIDTLREDIKPKFRSIHDAATDEIRAILSDEQKEKFESMEKRREERREKYKSRYKSWQHH